MCDGNPHYNFRCLVCNGLVEFQDFGWGMTGTQSTPSDCLVCAAHSDCLSRVASLGSTAEAVSLGAGWTCLICGDVADAADGLAILTEFGREGEGRRGRAPNGMAHATCVRGVAHPEYEFEFVAVRVG
jgi:hypothetical protein